MSLAPVTKSTKVTETSNHILYAYWTFSWNPNPTPPPVVWYSNGCAYLVSENIPFTFEELTGYVEVWTLYDNCVQIPYYRTTIDPREWKGFVCRICGISKTACNGREAQIRAVALATVNSKGYGFTVIQFYNSDYGAYDDGYK